MLEWESAGGRSTNNSRAKLRRCTCSPRRLAGRGLRCKDGLRRAKDKGSRDSNKDGQATDVAEWEGIHVEHEERAALTDGSESSDIEQGTIPGTARMDIHSTQADAIWGGGSLSNPRRRGI